MKILEFLLGPLLKLILTLIIVPYVWLETVREMGRCYFSGKQQGLVVLEIPLRCSK